MGHATVKCGMVRYEYGWRRWVTPLASRWIIERSNDLPTSLIQPTSLRAYTTDTAPHRTTPSPSHPRTLALTPSPSRPRPDPAHCVFRYTFAGGNRLLQGWPEADSSLF